MGALVFLVVVLAAIAFEAARRPVLRRLALRDAIRRPRETALVIAGSLLGTALITGSFIVGDTLDASIRATATTQLGPIDEVVEVPEAKTARRLERNLVALDDDRIDGVLSITTAQGAVASGTGPDRLAEPAARLLETNFDDAVAFGGDEDVTGISGDTPEPGSVVVIEDLAETIEVEPGDEVVAYLYGKRLELEVDRILPQRGVAGYWVGPETASPNAFVAPGTLAEIVDEDIPEGAIPPLTHVLVSNRGDVESGARLTDEVSGLIDDAMPSGSTLRVTPAKQEKLDDAELQGDAFGELFLGIGSFAIVAGILLLVNIFVMLAEERKSQLGMLRAIGLKRSHLVRAFIIEGAIYSLISSLVGAALGVGVGWAIVKLAAPIFGGFDAFSLELLFAVDPDSIVNGFCVGALISIVTVALTSIRISRVNIIRAIRELPEPQLRAARLRTVVAGTVLGAASIAWFVANVGNDRGWAAAILALPGAAFGLLPLLSKLVGRRTAVTAASGFAIAWGVFGNTLLDGQFYESGDIYAFVAQGILLTMSAVVLLTQSQETLEGGIRRVAARRLPLRLSVAYPLARRFRTGLTVGMFALVIFTMVMIATLSQVFGGQVETATKKEGGFDLLVTSNVSNPPTEKALELAPDVVAAETLLSGAALFHPEGFTEPQPWTTAGIERGFIQGGPPTLFERDEGFSSDREVWETLLEDPKAALVPVAFLQTGGGPPEDVVSTGDVLTMIDPLTGKTVERRIIGKVENDFAFSGVYMSADSLQEALGARAAPSRFYVEVDAPDAELSEVAARLQGRFVANGLAAESFRAIVERFQQANLQFLNLMQAYLALGLIVGIAGLGVVMVRAVRERRRDVGVLRALGFLTGQVRSAFVLEAGFVALEGILIGTVLALITSAQLVASGEFGTDVDWAVPWSHVLITTGTAFIASLLATAWPAQEASRIPPAVALRIAD